ncbi:EscU/YscU/HrcU family type III secretion system export apparatus switch protein [Holophaga foetida]|uniref:EscU/YscU/HrcU family type III secretion system export apparatus switch protein n=1 Tax=Holophaga foetida TaxID=35839 RepID=UPI0002474643|nr:EscU/YscU/HrcU family type III secretion system export apparatus switch protein [Holophaga foetida]
MAQQDLDRNHAASPYKLEKAREKGQVAKSPEVVAAVVFATAVVFLAWQGWGACRDMFRLDHALLIQATRLGPQSGALWPLVARGLRGTLVQLAPLLAMLAIAAVAANILQTGPVFSFHPIKPDWTRINPATGFKRVFTMRTLFVAIRSLVKLGFLALVCTFALKALLPQFYRLAGLSPLGLTRTLLDDFSALGLKIALTLGFLALLDLIYMRYEFAKQMRMSNREMKDEHKHREGDPRIRARLRELRREMLKRVMALRRTREADVLITNPTHVAVALRYEHGQMASPQLVAKGKGYMAAVMRKIAARHQIPVVQNPSLARQLYRELGVDHHVPPDLYAQVARIIVWIFARRDAQRARRQPTIPPSRSSAWIS